MTTRLLILLCLAVAGNASADISYNYVEGGLKTTNVKLPDPDDNIDAEGAEIALMLEIWGPVLATASASFADFSGGLRFDDTTIGLGAHREFTNDTSGFVTVSYLHRDIEVFGTGFDADGYGATLGYRVENQSPWEFLATVDYVNIETGVELGGGLSLTYDAVRRLSVQGGVRVLDEQITAFLGVRYFFDLNH